MANIEHLIKEGTLWRVDMKEVDAVTVKGKDISVKIFKHIVKTHLGEIMHPCIRLSRAS